MRHRHLYPPRIRQPLRRQDAGDFLAVGSGRRHLILLIMADNYIEKKMEELRSGIHAARRTSRRTCVRQSSSGTGMPGDLTLRFAELRVFVCGDAATSLGRAVVSALREVGCKVAFSGADSARGTEMSRSLGAQFHPLRNPSDNAALAASARYTISNWRGVDAVIGLGFIPSFLPSVSRTISLLHAAPTSLLSVSSASSGSEAEMASFPCGASGVMRVSTCSEAEIAALCRLLLSPDAFILPSSLALVVPELIHCIEP